MYRAKTGKNAQRRPLSPRVRLVIWLLIVALATGGVYFLARRGTMPEDTYQKQVASRLQYEIQRAVSQGKNLTSTGSSNSADVLGRIRAHVHAMEALNEINLSLYGEAGRLYEQATFDSFYAIVDDYSVKLQTGAKISVPLSQLMEQLAYLQEITNGIGDRLL